MASYTELGCRPFSVNDMTCDRGSLVARGDGVRMTSCHRPGCWNVSFICQMQCAVLVVEGPARCVHTTATTTTHSPSVFCTAVGPPAAADSCPLSTSDCSCPASGSKVPSGIRPDRGGRTPPCTSWHGPDCCRPHSWQRGGWKTTSGLQSPVRMRMRFARVYLRLHIPVVTKVLGLHVPNVKRVPIAAGSHRPAVGLLQRK